MRASTKVSEGIQMYAQTCCCQLERLLDTSFVPETGDRPKTLHLFSYSLLNNVIAIPEKRISWGLT